ncbi:MAG: hypothetical protein ACYDIA_02355 [Candidatus Humimicrobiaceae bacterium]
MLKDLKVIFNKIEENGISYSYSEIDFDQLKEINEEICVINDCINANTPDDYSNTITRS